MKATFATLAFAGMLGMFLATAARADITLDFSSLTNASINVTGTGSGSTAGATIGFTNNGSGYGFDITGGGTGAANNLNGILGGTYSYTASGITSTPIGSETLQTASLSSSGGSLSIFDGTTSFTGNVAGVNVSTLGASGTINFSASINLTNVSYSGTNADLVTLYNDAHANGGSLTISFTDVATKYSLSDMTGSSFGGLSTSYSGTIAALSTPEPSTMAIAGLGALGMIGYGLRRRKALGA